DPVIVDPALQVLPLSVEREITMLAVAFDPAIHTSYAFRPFGAAAIDCPEPPVPGCFTVLHVVPPVSDVTIFMRTEPVAGKSAHATMTRPVSGSTVIQGLSAKSPTMLAGVISVGPTHVAPPSVDLWMQSVLRPAVLWNSETK